MNKITVNINGTILTPRDIDRETVEKALNTALEGIEANLGEEEKFSNSGSYANGEITVTVAEKQEPEQPQEQPQY